jgi:HEAT repeat protein
MDAHFLRTECERIEKLGRGPASDDAREYVENALQSKWEGVQVTAARALSKWGDERSIQAIRRLVGELAKKSARWSAAGAVVDALRPHLSSTDIDWVLRLCLKESNRHNRSTLMLLLLGLPPHETRAALQRLTDAGGCDPAEIREALRLIEMRTRSVAAQQTAARDRAKRGA